MWNDSRLHGVHSQSRMVDTDRGGRCRRQCYFWRGKGSRKFPGLGAGITPGLHRHDVADKVIYVSDKECVEGCRALVREEAILAGASSGGVISAIRRMSGMIPSGAVVAAILPDRGERYLNTVYSDEWVGREIGYTPSN